MLHIDGYIINKNNIAYIGTTILSTDGYKWRETFTIDVYFIGRDEPLHLKTYDKDEFHKWLKDLED